jgi:small subunit ribosomal protein S4
MARYRGPKTKKSRSFGETIYGFDKSFERRKYPPGQHGNTRRRRQKSDYALQLMEKQKAKYTYGYWSVSFATFLKRQTVRKGLLVRFSCSFSRLVWIIPFFGWG